MKSLLGDPLMLNQPGEIGVDTAGGSNSLTNSTAELPKELCRLNTDHWYAPAPAFLYHYWINPWHRLPSRPLNKQTNSEPEELDPKSKASKGGFSHHQTKPSSWWHVLGPHPSQVTHFKRNAWLNGGIMRIWMEYSWDMNGILMTCPPEIFDIAMKDGWQWPMEWPMEFHGLLSLLIKWWFSIPKRQPPRVSNEELDLIDTISPKLGFHHGDYGSEGGGYFCS